VGEWSGALGEKLVTGKRILITGGNGLIARRMAQHLAGAGCFVKLGTRSPENFRVNEPSVDVVLIDWEDDKGLRALCQGVDIIVNAMGMNANDCIQDPVGALTTNGVFTTRLMQAAVVSGVRRFVQLSTAHVYSASLVGTITEMTSTTNSHPYASSHLAADLALLWAAQRDGIEVAVMRLSNAFGRPVNSESPCWTLLVNELCRQAVELRTLRLRSSGIQHRDFVPMTKVCGLILKACLVESIEELKVRPKDPPVFNVGSGFSMSVRKMAELIQERCQVVLGYRVELKLPETSPYDCATSLSFLSETLGVPLSIRLTDLISEVDELLIFCRGSFVAQKPR
jgi:UDP-glucose 4-epimerase